MSVKKLNLGCGNDIRKGWLNLDCVYLPGVDVVHDLEKLPMPFNDEEFDEILCQDILEHLEYVPILRELFRILKHSGKLIIRVPHFTSINNFADPTHKKLFSIRTFEFFTKISRFKVNHYFDYHFSNISYSKITFSKRPFIYNYPVELLVNSFPRMQRFYEVSFLSRIFPAENIIVEIIK